MIFILDWSDLLVLQNTLSSLVQTWTNGIDNALVGIIGFNPETFLTDLVNNIASLAQDVTNINLGSWDFITTDWSFDISPAFLDIIQMVKTIVDNNESFELYFIDVLDQLYIDFDALSGNWIWHNETSNRWQFDVDVLNNHAQVQQFLSELAAQLDNLDISEIQGWLVLDPLQQLFDQLYEQLDASQQATLNDILTEIGLPELSLIASSARTGLTGS